MSPLEENINLKKQLLSSYTQIYFATKAAERSAIEAQLAKEQINIIKRDMNETINLRIDKECERLNKARDEAILALSALNEEAAKHVKEAIMS